MAQGAGMTQGAGMAQRADRVFVAAALGAALVLAARVSAEPPAPPQGAEPAPSGRVVVGAKNFTESHLLAEMMALVIEAHTDLTVVRRTGLGGTMVCFEALREGEIDLYPDYTGTGWSVVLGETEKVDSALQAFLHVQERYRELWDVEWLAPFGPNNTYALAMDEGRAQELGVRTISDLRAHQDEIRIGFSIEFMNRPDGWAGLAPFYDLAPTDVRGMEHGLAYEAISSGRDRRLIDAYSTDGKLLRFRPACAGGRPRTTSRHYRRRAGGPSRDAPVKATALKCARLLEPAGPHACRTPRKCNASTTLVEVLRPRALRRGGPGRSCRTRACWPAPSSRRGPGTQRSQAWLPGADGSIVGRTHR